MKTLAGLNVEPVGRGRLCPVCGKDSWCLVGESREFTICARVGSDRRIGEAGWRHGKPPSQVRRVEAARAVSAVHPGLAVAADRAQGNLLRSPHLSLERRLGLPESAVKAFRWGWIDEISSWSCPRCSAGGTVIGVHLRATDGRKWCLAGSRNGIHVPRPQIPGGPLLITEGPTDATAVYGLGFPAVGLPSASQGIGEAVEYCRRLRYTEAVIVADNDEAGDRSAAALAVRLRAVVPAVRIVRPPHPHKDVRDWIKAAGSPELARHLISAAVAAAWPVALKVRLRRRGKAGAA